MPCGWEDNCTSCITLTMCQRLQSLTGWWPKKGRWAPRLHSSWGMAHFTFLGAYCLPNWCLFLTFGVIFWTCLQTVIEVTQVLVISLVKFWSQSWQIPSKPQDVKSICCSLTGMSPSLKLESSSVGLSTSVTYQDYLAGEAYIVLFLSQHLRLLGFSVAGLMAWNSLLDFTWDLHKLFQEIRTQVYTENVHGNMTLVHPVH